MWVVPCIPTTFDGDVLFELPLINNLDDHCGQMQGMDRKYNGHFWCKVKTTNIKNYFNYIFRSIGAWVIWNVETSYIIIWCRIEPLMKLLGLMTLFTQVKLFYPNICSTRMVMNKLNLSNETNYVK